MNTLLVAYVPVLHRGYLEFFRRYQGTTLLLIAPELYGEEFERLNRETRSVLPDDMLAIILSLKIFRKVGFLDRSTLDQLPQGQIVLPDEDVSRFVAESYLKDRSVRFESVFLRFDMPKTLSQSPVLPDRLMAVSDFDREVMGAAYQLAQHSPDWWRQVAAALVRDGQIRYAACNRHMPSNHTYYALGDPRNNFSAGQRIDLSGAQHAEKVIISTAAKEGVSLDGASMYVTTFPCPSCAYDIATAGVSRVYFTEGYSLLLAQEVFVSRGVELVHVSMSGS